jgi:hypothetical protein
MWVAIRSGGPAGRPLGYREGGAAVGALDVGTAGIGVGVGLVDEGGDERPFEEHGRIGSEAGLGGRRSLRVQLSSVMVVAGGRFRHCSVPVLGSGGGSRSWCQRP